MENKYLGTEQSKAKELEKVKEIEEDKPKEVSSYWYIWPISYGPYDMRDNDQY